jgi:hypothetical protein
LLATDCVATTISAMITLDPNDQEGDPSANAGDSFSGKRNQNQESKIMQLKSSASMAQNKQIIMNSLQAKK